MRKPAKQLHTVIDPPWQQNVGWYASMAVSEGPLWDPFVYEVEDIPAASDIHVFTIINSVALYFQYIARAGRDIRRVWLVNLGSP